MKKNISLVIADDHEIFRDGLALLINKQENMSLAGQATNGRELVQLVADKKPDMVLTDIKMPYLDGIAACRLLLQQDPGLKIIALSMFEEEHLIVEMLEAGAEPLQDLIAALHTKLLVAELERHGGSRR